MKFINHCRVLLVVLLLFNVFLLGKWLEVKNGQNFPEQKILAEKNSYQELRDFFKELAEKKGALYAYNLLRVANLPENTDLHLLGHVVGDVLYQKEGKDGIRICNEDFRNACSHSIVIGLLLYKGEDALVDISKACRKAPGGSGAYTMCFHGLGHGVLAYSDYDLEKAVSLCAKTATKEFGGREQYECIGGTIMEIISGGGHNPKLWEEKSKLYLRKEDPLYPCTSAFMPEEARPLCFVYLTPHLLQVAGADLGNPTPQDYQRAFKYCEGISPNDIQNRDSCFGGFGKEFVVLAKGRDIRKIESLSEDEMRSVYGWCNLSADNNGVKSCIRHAVNSLFWGGENDVLISINFCNSIPLPTHKSECFNHLIGSVNYYIKRSNYRRSFCSKLPENFVNQCRDIIR